MASTTFDQRLSLHSRIVSLQQLILSQESSISTLQSELDSLLSSPPSEEDLRSSIEELLASSSSFQGRVAKTLANRRQAESYLQVPEDPADKLASGEDENDGETLDMGESARSSVAPDDLIAGGTSTPAGPTGGSTFEGSPLKNTFQLASPKEPAKQPSKASSSSRKAATKASALSASQDTHVSATPSPSSAPKPLPASSPAKASKPSAKDKPLSKTTSNTRSKASPAPTPNAFSPKVKEEKTTRSSAIPPAPAEPATTNVVPASPVPSSGFSTANDETEDEKPDLDSLVDSPASARRSSKKGKATQSVSTTKRLASPAMSTSSTGTSRSGLARLSKGKAAGREASPTSTTASSKVALGATTKGKKAIKERAAREEATRSTSGLGDEETDDDLLTEEEEDDDDDDEVEEGDEDEDDEEGYSSEPIKRTAKATAARMRNAKLRRESATRSITGSQGSVAGEELTDEQKDAVHEQKKLERRIRDRARREREREKKASKKEEQAAAHREKKRKLVEETTGSQAGGSERSAKRAREDFSETPDDASHSGPSTTRRSSISLSTGKLPQSLLNPKTFKKTIDQLFQSISNHRSSSIFQVPIRANDAPDYRSIVHRPMDLRTIKGRIRDGHIGTVDEFERDIMLMFANALIYNDPESEVYLRTEEMMADAELSIKQFRQLQQRLATKEQE